MDIAKNLLLLCTWIATGVASWIQYGYGWGLTSFLFPPADIILMIMTGTWPLFLAFIIVGFVSSAQYAKEHYRRF